MHLKIKASDEVKALYNEDTNHATDSGFDLYCPNDQIIPALALGELVHLGITIAAYTDDGKPCGYWLAPRGSLSKTPLRLANSLGLMDMDYRGEVCCVVDNLKWAYTKIICGGSGGDYVWEPQTYTIKAGVRLFQAVSFTGEPITYEFVDELDDTERGDGKLGSTGV